MKYFMMIKLPRIQLEPALEVRVMTVVAFWKIQPGYILLSSLSALQRARI